MQFRSKLKRFLMFNLLLGMSIYVILQIQEQRTALVGWDVTVSRNVRDYIFPNTSTTIIKPLNFCNAQAFLMVFVFSSPDNFEAREMIRQSWGLSKNISNAVVNIYFLLGLTMDLDKQQEIETEGKIYNDIIQEDFMDSYNNLTLKSLMMLKLVVNDCNNKVKYVMKTDDDMFVNLNNLVKRLRMIPKPEQSLGVLFGYLMCNVDPVRQSYEKWYVPSYMYRGNTYPNYLSGTGYVTSVDVCIRLFEVALDTPLINLEDVYLTGICARRAGIRPRHNINFNYRNIKFDPCLFRNLITSHNYKPFQLYQLHRRVQSSDLEKECLTFKESLKRNKKQHTKVLLELKLRVAVPRNRRCF